MVLELKAPEEASWAALSALSHEFLSYVLSFLYVGIYWNAHHHLMQAHGRVSGAVLWANLHLMFWLSLLPFATRWMGEAGLMPAPVMLFGAILFIQGIAYLILERALDRADGLTGADLTTPGWKAIGSEVVYLAGIAVAALGWEWTAFAILWIPALLWLVPDRRIERALSEGAAP
jgi:uncharacterized membrane protein